jgi:hypothetical protein
MWGQHSNPPGGCLALQIAQWGSPRAAIKTSTFGVTYNYYRLEQIALRGLLALPQ